MACRHNRAIEQILLLILLVLLRDGVLLNSLYRIL
jgi:hypothetical protein